jgi:hypothetical protein
MRAGVEELTTVVREDDQCEEEPRNVTVDTTKKSAAVIWLA